ncbi:MAG: hypothetical protein QM708_07280 [Propioniciclava sp.]|uniref:hypothetical protein n=1 Tax=Propioniciclava sp. TaxID=2038686 RepID=UPI0039E299D3
MDDAHTARLTEQWGLTADAQRALLSRLRPRTASVEFVVRPRTGAPEPLADLLAPFAPASTIGVGRRPGYPRPEPEAVVLVCRTQRSLFALLADIGLFTVEPSPHGDHITPTALGTADLGFFDADGRLLCAVVTHEGLVFADAALLTTHETAN